MSAAGHRRATLSCVIAVCVATGVARGANQATVEFEILCSLYGIAKNLSSTQIPQRKEVLRADALVQELMFLKIQTGSEEQYKYGTDGKTPTDEQERKEKAAAWEQQKSRIAREIFSGERKDAFQRPPDTFQRRRIGEKIKRLSEVAEKLASQIKKQVAESGQALQAARNLTLEAVFGTSEGGFKTDAARGKTFDVTGSGKGCGNNGDEKAGISLVSDITCICVGRTSDDQNFADSACYSTYDINTDVSDEAKLAGSDGWGKIQGTCEKVWKDHRTPLQDAIRNTLSEFKARVGVKKEFILGGTSSSTTCTGASNANNVCVIYKHNVDNGAGFDGIPWFKKFSEAATALQREENLFSQVEKDLQKLERLNESSWEVVENLATFSEQNQQITDKTINNSSNTTAQTTPRKESPTDANSMALCNTLSPFSLAIILTTLI